MLNITFVDENDDLIGYGTQAEAISNGIAHRISRVFIFNTNCELLIQKRSPNVNVPNKWDQSAAGHVDEGEDYHTAAQRELKEEVGIEVPLKEIGKFYTEEADEDKVKKRFNMLYSGLYDGRVEADAEEVSGTKWINPAVLEKWMNDSPEDFTQGFLQSYQYFLKNSK